jgi:hypothetical protein
MIAPLPQGAPSVSLSSPAKPELLSRHDILQSFVPIPLLSRFVALQAGGVRSTWGKPNVGGGHLLVGWYLP